MLSALHQLNAAGYAVVFLLGGLGLAAWWTWVSRPCCSWPAVPRLCRRFKRLCPFLFLLFASLALLSGLLYPANYYDAMAYRLPRVLHWLADGRWHWIHTGFHRVNTRGCGFEWLATPVIAFTRTDRFLFLTSFVSFCFLPGLIYGCFIRLGVNRRVAYCWMWLLPLGACFLLQAGTLGNDLVAAVFALAALDYSLRARETGRVQQLWLALLAGALATAVKANCLPLALVWAVALAPCWRLVLRRALPTLGVALLALGCSFVPTAVLNLTHCGDWTGGRAEGFHFNSAKPWVRVLGNTELLVLYHLTPPVMPFAGYWNEHIAPRLVPSGMRKAVEESFTLNGGTLLALEELQTDSAGLGAGVALLLLFSTLAAARAGRACEPPRLALGRGPRWLVLAATAVAVLALLQTSFVKSTVRLLCPYYCLMVLPLLLRAGHRRVVRTRGFRAGVIILGIVSAVPLVLRPDRPLLPVRTILAAVEHLARGSHFLARTEQVYSVYGQRGDAFAEVRRLLPPEAAVLGIITYDDPESALWKPYGARRVIHVCPGDTPGQLKAQGVHYVLAAEKEFNGGVFPGAFPDWLKEMNGEIVQTIPLALRAADGPKAWDLVKIN